MLLFRISSTNSTSFSTSWLLEQACIKASTGIKKCLSLSAWQQALKGDGEGGTHAKPKRAEPKA